MKSTTTVRTKTRRSRSRRSRSRPALRFSPYAWAKLLFLRDAGPTEVGGFGISAADDPLLVEDLRLVRQSSTATTVCFEDAAVADYFDDSVDAGLTPDRFARIWIHTHPGESPKPSGTDERTFARVFGGCDWAVMAILARGGESYARLRFAAGPGGELEIPVEVDFACSFAAAEPEAWAEGYARCVTDETSVSANGAERFARSCLRDLAAAYEPLSEGRWSLGFEPDLFDLTDPLPELWEFADDRGY